MKVRLQKFLSEAGVASRRRGERLIAEGRVSVNGLSVHEVGTKVNPAEDHVRLDDRPVCLKEKVYLALNKPRGCVCSRARQNCEPILGDYLPGEWGHLYSVGRLDRESEGLIFLTNDGEFSLKVSHPRYGVTKRYRVEIGGTVDESMLRRLREGVRVEGEWLKAERARALRSSVLEIELVEGRNREIRRMLGALGCRVGRLRRDRIGAIGLGRLKPGEWRRLERHEIDCFLEARGGAVTICGEKSEHRAPQASAAGAGLGSEAS